MAAGSSPGAGSMNGGKSTPISILLETVYRTTTNNARQHKTCGLTGTRWAHQTFRITCADSFQPPAVPSSPYSALSFFWVRHLSHSFRAWWFLLLSVGNDIGGSLYTKSMRRSPRFTLLSSRRGSHRLSQWPRRPRSGGIYLLCCRCDLRNLCGVLWCPGMRKHNVGRGNTDVCS